MEFYMAYKPLIVAAMLCGIYLPSIEKIYGQKRYIKALKYVYVFPACALIVYFMAGFKFVFLDAEEKLGEMLHGAVLFTYTVFSLITSFSFYMNTGTFEKVFQLWESLFQEDFFSKRREALLEKNRNFTMGWLKKFGGTSIFCTFLYAFAPFFSSEKKLGHPVGIPYRNQSPDFELVASLELFVAYFGFLTMIVYDSLTMVLLSMEEAQFRHLKGSLSEIIDWVSVTSSGEVQVTINKNLKETVHSTDVHSPLLRDKFMEAEEYIKLWISHHKQILQFHEELKRIFFYPFAVKFLMFVLILCQFCFLIVTNNLTSEDLAIGIVYCANVYATFYINISYADSTKESAESLFEEAFGNSWHLFPEKLKTGFKIILLRCHRPVDYTALKIYPITARSFLKIFTSGYTFFTFLLQINWKKEKELNGSVSIFCRVVNHINKSQ